MARAIVPKVNPNRGAGKVASPSADRVATTKAVVVNATKDVESGTRGAVKVLTVKEVKVVAAGRAADFNHAPVAVRRGLAANASGR